MQPWPITSTWDFSRPFPLLSLWSVSEPQVSSPRAFANRGYLEASAQESSWCCFSLSPPRPNGEKLGQSGAGPLSTRQRSPRGDPGNELTAFSLSFNLSPFL